MKKSLIFVIAVLSAFALITACSQATDSDVTSPNRHSIHGTIAAEYLQAKINDAIAGGEQIILEDGLTITNANASFVDFKNARVQVAGTVTAANITINAVDASVTWLEEGAFTGTGMKYLYRNAEEVLKPDNSSRLLTANAGVQFVDRLQDILQTATDAAVRNFTLGEQPDYDYSTGTAVPARVNATQSLANLYVLGTLTVPSTGANPSLLTMIYALGTVDVTGNNDVVFSTGSKVTMADSAVLTSSILGSKTITLGTLTIPNVRLDSGKDITVQGTAGAFTIKGKLDGTGTLKVVPAVTGLTINGGNGNVEFMDTVSTATNTVLTVKNTGKTTFNGPVTINSGTADPDLSVIAGDVDFKADVTRTKGAVSFGGDVYLYNGKKITLSDTQTVTLAAGKQILVGGGAVTGVAETVPFTPVLEAAVKTVLTPATGAVLTAAAAYTFPYTEEAVADAKKITLSTQKLTIGSGTLRVVGEGILAIDQTTLATKGIAPVRSGFLTLAPGAKVNFTANTTSKLDFGTADGEATISGDSASVTSLTATAAVTLGDDTISGAGAVLVLGTEGTAGTNDAVITTAATKNLTLDGVTLDLSGSGKVIVPGDGFLTLKNQGKLLLAAEDGSNFPNTSAYIKYSANFGTITGGSRNAIGAAAQTDTPTLINIVSIAHSSDAEVRIKADGSNALTFITGANVPQFSETNS